MLLRAWEQSADGHSSLTVHSTSTRTSVHPPASSGKAGIGRRVDGAGIARCVHRTGRDTGTPNCPKKRIDFRQAAARW
jgi:hypothetical protein